MRNCLFISHANPDDNPFVIWLSSKLQLLGYKVWCDLDRLKGGEKFWNNIEDQIRNNSIKFLLVVSQTSLSKDGVMKEFHFAEAIAKQDQLHDFLIPIRLHDVPFTIRIGIGQYVNIDFTKNWVLGLKALIEKLDEDKVPKLDKSQTGEVLLNQIKFPSENSIIKKKEMYFTNWWSFENIPEFIYFIEYLKEAQASAVMAKVNIPIVRHGNCLICFDKNMPSDVILKLDDGFDFQEEGLCLPTNVHQISIEAIITASYTSTIFPNTRDAENGLKRLLNRSLHLYLRTKNLSWYELASKENCYYYKNGVLKNNKTVITYPNRKVRKNLVGKSGDGFWHYALSYKVILKPFPCYILRSHILFSDDGLNIWINKGKLHSARRKKGKSWFNEHWRDQMIAFLNSLAELDSGKINIPITDINIIQMPIFTKTFYSEFGYQEPTSNDRQQVLESFEDEVDVKLEIEEGGL